MLVQLGIFPKKCLKPPPSVSSTSTYAYLAENEVEFVRLVLVVFQRNQTYLQKYARPSDWIMKPQGAGWT